MTKRQETGMAVIVGVVLMLIILLTSCATKKQVTEYVTIHDTTVVFRTDTLKDVRIVTHRDTVTQKEVHTITLNNVGDTLKEIHHYHDSERTIIVDSTNRFRAIVDSLRAVIQQQQNKVVVKEKPVISWWEYGIFACLIFFILAFLWKLK